MSAHRMTRALLALAVVLAAGTATTACSDEELLGHTPDEVEPEGLTISIGGQTAVTVQAGQVTGSLTVQAGNETENFTVVFTDHDGQPLDPEESDFVVEGQSADEATAEFHRIAAFTGHLEGHAAGETTIVFKLMHPPGPDAHSNFDSPPIPVTVTP